MPRGTKGSKESSAYARVSAGNSNSCCLSASESPPMTSSMFALASFAAALRDGRRRTTALRYSHSDAAPARAKPPGPVELLSFALP